MNRQQAHDWLLYMIEVEEQRCGIEASCCFCTVYLPADIVAHLDTIELLRNWEHNDEATHCFILTKPNTWFTVLVAPSQDDNPRVVIR